MAGDVAICIPWRYDGPERRRIFAWVYERWFHLADAVGAEIVVADAEGDEFSRSRSRNRAAVETDAEHLVFVDADTTVPSVEVFRAALQLVRDGTAVLPYTHYYNLTTEATEQLLEEPTDVVIDRPRRYNHDLTTSVSGVVMLPRGAFEAVGRYDESFVGWGYEDNAFYVAVETMWHPWHRMNSFVVHLEHPPGPRFESPNIEASRRRFRAYEACAGDVRRMQQLISSAS